MIIQTGMRTDIPAFYSEWFLNRLNAGYVLVRNPYNENQVTRYSLSPDVVDLIKESGADAAAHGCIKTIWAILVCNDHGLWN